jgi:hypothetical protein
MKKEFVPYEQALALKELGFDEPCFGAFIGKEFKFFDFSNDLNGYVNNKNLIIGAPTFSQAFKFFREKYNLRGSIMDFIDDETGIEWDYEIALIGTDLDENGHYKPLIDYSTDDESRKFKTYEKAETACLDKLIEIVKKK